VAGFRNYYDDLRSLEFPTRPGVPILLGNLRNAQTAGVEVGTSVQLADRWRVHGSYSYLHLEMTLDPGSTDLTRGVNEANDPSYFASLRSHLDLPHGFALDGFVRHVARRRSPVVPAYSELDVRLGWALRGGWELSLIGQNLLHDRHPEFGTPTPLRYEFERGVYARSVWRF
jgi:iron complex outermembrane receptor protein